MSREASPPHLPEGLGRIRGRANLMVDQKHQPKWHVSDKPRSNARAVRRKMPAERVICDNAPAHRFQNFEPQTIVHHARRDAYFMAQACGVVGFNNVDVMKSTAGVLETAVALGGSPSPSLTLPRERGRGPGHAGREDVP
jgi:hypothetical protein